MEFARSGDQGFRFSILLREAFVSSVPFMLRLSSSSINGFSMVSLFVLMISLILSVCAMMLWYLT